MLRFAVKLAIFMLPLLVLFAAVEYKARAIPSNFAVKRELLEQNIKRVQVFIAGSSHAYYAVKPKLLGVPAVSIAYPGQDIYYDTRILLKYLPQAASARLVIITISYFSFESTIEADERQPQGNYYHKFWGVPREKTAFRIADYSAVGLFGIERSRSFLLHGKIEEGDRVDETGGNANDRATDRSAVLSAAAAKRHTAVMNAEHIDANVKYLDELFDALKARNVKAAIITAPAFKTYYENLDRERYARMQDTVESLAAKHELNYYNYIDDARFGIDDFQDSDHLNTQGAEKFSLILRDEVVEKYVS